MFSKVARIRFPRPQGWQVWHCQEDLPESMGHTARDCKLERRWCRDCQPQPQASTNTHTGLGHHRSMQGCGLSGVPNATIPGSLPTSDAGSRGGPHLPPFISADVGRTHGCHLQTTWFRLEAPEPLLWALAPRALGAATAPEQELYLSENGPLGAPRAGTHLHSQGPGQGPHVEHGA